MNAKTKTLSFKQVVSQLVLQRPPLVGRTTVEPRPQLLPQNFNSYKTVMFNKHKPTSAPIKINTFIYLAVPLPE